METPRNKESLSVALRDFDQRKHKGKEYSEAIGPPGKCLVGEMRDAPGTVDPRPKKRR
jgi:hypothetical protein